MFQQIFIYLQIIFYIKKNLLNSVGKSLGFFSWNPNPFLGWFGFRIPVNLGRRFLSFKAIINLIIIMEKIYNQSNLMI